MAALRKRRGTDANVNQENAEMEQAEFDFGSSEETVNFFLKLEEKVNVFYSLRSHLLIANMEPFKE